MTQSQNSTFVENMAGNAGSLCRLTNDVIRRKIISPESDVRLVSEKHGGRHVLRVYSESTVGRLLVSEFTSCMICAREMHELLSCDACGSVVCQLCSGLCGKSCGFSEQQLLICKLCNWDQV